jgi:hypothetical protein
VGLVVSAQPAPPAGDKIAGLYACEGIRPDGVAYRGVVQIVRHDNTYHLLWTLAPDEQYLGIGILSEGVLAVSYFGGLPGVVVYRIGEGQLGPQLTGRWTVVEADGQVFSETLTRLPADARPPVLVEPSDDPGPSRRGLKPA